MLAFSKCSVTRQHPPEALVSDVTGYVARGAMLALMGPAGSGTATLLSVLAGREQDLQVRGEFALDGASYDPTSLQNGRLPFGYVPADFSLVGEMTVRETLRHAAALANVRSSQSLDARVSAMMESLKIAHVANSVVGTALRRGLSGGEKRRVAVAQQMLRQPACLLLDEPTSGLDSNAALKVVLELKKACRSGMSVVLRLMQPSSKILEQMDSLLIMSRGRTVFFGPPRALRPYLSRVDLPVPQSMVPVEYLLFLSDRSVDVQATDLEAAYSPQAQTRTLQRGQQQQQQQEEEEEEHEQLLGQSARKAEAANTLLPLAELQGKMSPSILAQLKERAQDFEFGAEYAMSNLAKRQERIVQSALLPAAPSRSLQEVETMEAGKEQDESELSVLRPKASFCTQFFWLFKRNLLIALRDPTLYWFQFLLFSGFGFVVGACFWDLPRDIDNRLGDVSNGLTWLCFVGTYIHVFKIYHKMKEIRLFEHELANGEYDIPAYFCADQLTAILATFPMQVCGLLLSYWMMGNPADELGYVALMFYLLGLTAESLCSLICHFAPSASAAMILSQGLLVVLCLFTGGTFLRWSQVADEWTWLMHLSFYTHGSRGLMLATYPHLTYHCAAQHIVLGPRCAHPALGVYACSSVEVMGGQVTACAVSGDEVLAVFKEMGHGQYELWNQIYWLLLATGCLRVLTLLVLYYPPGKVLTWARLLCGSETDRQLLEQSTRIDLLEAKLQHLSHRMRDALEQLKPAAAPVAAAPATAAAAERGGRAALLLGQAKSAAAGVEQAVVSALRGGYEPVAQHERHDSLQLGRKDSLVAMEEGGFGDGDDAPDRPSKTLVVVEEPAEAKSAMLHAAPAPNDPHHSHLLLPKEEPEQHELHRRVHRYRSRTFRAQKGRGEMVWHNVRLWLPNGKVLLKDVAGRASGGRVLAIMGPSGAGKTTLLNALTGRASYASVSGYAQHNSMPLSRVHLELVPQHTNLNQCFTVRETWAQMDALKSRRRSPGLLEELLNVLGLKQHEHTKLKYLDQGLHKRVAVGCALLGRPQVLCLDEPTTGLDSSAALSLVSYVQRMARAFSVMVVATIHQPSGAVFDLCDDLLLLSAGGHVAFFGSRPDASRYFAQLGYVPAPDENPADFYLDLISQAPTQLADSEQSELAELYPADDSHEQRIRASEKRQERTWLWAALFRREQQLPKMIADWLAHTQQLPRAPRHDQPGVLTRLRVLLARELLYDLREPGVHLLRLLELTVLGLFTGSLYYKLALDPLMLTEWAGLLFFSMWSVLFSGIAGTPVIVADRFVIKEEYLNGTYGIGTYAVAKFVSALPFHALAALIYQALVWGLADVTDDVGVFCFQLLVAALLLVFMEGVVMCVAEVAKEPMLTTSFSMIFLGCLFLFSGFFIKLDDMPLPTRWIPYMMATKYALPAALDNMLSPLSFVGTSVTGTGVSFSYTLEGEQLLRDQFNQKPNYKKWKYDLVALVGFTLLVRLLHLFAMYFNWTRVRSKSGLGMAPRSSVVNSPHSQASTRSLNSQAIGSVTQINRSLNSQPLSSNDNEQVWQQRNSSDEQVRDYNEEAREQREESPLEVREQGEELSS